LTASAYGQIEKLMLSKNVGLPGPGAKHRQKQKIFLKVDRAEPGIFSFFNYFLDTLRPILNFAARGKL
jgi:hypothetical protein